MKQTWYADDAAATGKMDDLRTWWEEISTMGQYYGYFVNASKTWLVIKEGLDDKARSAFGDTNVQITSEGRPYL